MAVDLASEEIAGAFLVKDYALWIPYPEELNSYSSEKVIVAIEEKLLTLITHPVTAALLQKGQVV